MYDPARDSWNASGDNSPDLKHDNDESGETEDETPIRIESTEPDFQDGSTEDETPRRGGEGAEGEIEGNYTEDNSVDENNIKEIKGTSQEPPQATQENTEASQQTPQEAKPQTPATPTSPPRKFKKPSRRTSISEREKKTKELREKIDKRPHDEKEDSSQPDSKKLTVEGIRRHYNERPNTSIQERQQSPIFKLRSFNNLIKSALIKRFSSRGQIVLDIGCGKGGDLPKWTKQQVSGLIGIDIADVSIEQAKQRYEKLRNKRFWADFCVGDAFEQRVEDIVHPDAFPVDFVSSQFTLQYSFESEKRARMMLANVGRALKRGCTFIGTIPDSNVLLNHISNLPEGAKEWGNSIYRIKFENEPPKTNDDLSNIYGYKYDFFLEDAVTNVPEYVVPFDAFCSLALEYGLRLIYRKNFLEFFDDEITDYHSRDHTNFLCRILHVHKEDGSPGIEGDQREAAGIYTVFAFEKQ